MRANAVLSRLRTDLGTRLGRVDGRAWDVLFVVDFPLFERGEDGRLTYVHQPFVAPLEEDLPLLETAPERVRGTHYDIVINGVELGSGSLRNHRADVQRRILEIMGYTKEQSEARFGFLFDALDAGAPPHGGFAFGYDRWVMLLGGFAQPARRDRLPEDAARAGSADERADARRARAARGAAPAHRAGARRDENG